MNANFQTAVSLLPGLIQAMEMAPPVASTGQPLTGAQKTEAVITGVLAVVPDTVPYVPLIKMLISALVAAYNTFAPMFADTPATPAKAALPAGMVMQPAAPA